MKLLAGLPIVEQKGELANEVTGLTCDSREVKPGNLFVALRGAQFDGHRFLRQVHENQAAGAVVESIDPDIDLPQVRVQDTLAALPQIAARFYHHPARQMHLTGITGSNGKTTSTYMLEQIWRAAGEDAAVIGTIENRFRDFQQEAPNTTPLPHDMHCLLRRLADMGCQRVVMEVSSHGLVLHRVDEMEFEVALFTNLSQDHLDFHQTMEAYRDAKLRLFTHYLKENGTAVLNIDDEAGRYYQRVLTNRTVLTFGFGDQADVRAYDVTVGLQGCRFQLQLPGQNAITIETPLVGQHNIYNILGVAAAAFASGIAPQAIADGIHSLQAVPGRLEPVANSAQAQAVVDYSHTPDALEKCLLALRELPHKRILTVFGCGGDRDRGKRPQMGEIALRLSHYVYVTSDNPRTEDPMQIIADIEAGMASGQDRYTVIADRRAAIEAAVNDLQTGDVLLVAGKGHEDYQIIGHTKHHFDDREVLREALAAAGKGGEA